MSDNNYVCEMKTDEMEVFLSSELLFFFCFKERPKGVCTATSEEVKRTKKRPEFQCLLFQMMLVSILTLDRIARAFPNCQTAPL